MKFLKNFSDFITSNKTVKNLFSLQKSTAEVHWTDWCFMHWSTINHIGSIAGQKIMEKDGVSLFFIFLITQKTLI